MFLDGPWAPGAFKLLRTATAVSIVTSHGDRLDNDDCAGGIANRLGFDPPLDSLRTGFWGVPEPGHPAPGSRWIRSSAYRLFSRTGGRSNIRTTCPSLASGCRRKLTVQRQGVACAWLWMAGIR